MIKDIVKKSLAGEELSPEEIASLFRVPLFSQDSALIQQASRQKSEKASNNMAEVHAQLGLNLAPCPRNCKFCAFAAENGIFKESHQLTAQEAINRAKRFELDGANAIFLMGTADYSFAKFIEMGQEIKNNLDEQTILIANVGDFSFKEAKQLKTAGFSGVYHAIRLGEGRDSTISPSQRLETFQNAKEAGLLLGTCLEPVGPEHTIEELVEKTLITKDAEPTYSGAARRIPIPNTELAQYGIVSEAKMAHILAVVRLALGYQVPGNCTHEPNVIGAAAGANLFWSESGSNPRDTEEDTEGKRGLTVSECRNVFAEAEWEVLKGPSKFCQNSLLTEGV
ncbi:MAG: radical SAM protein [Candidatus Omnitrophica bacterium]|nr:radical SAM protein [Candidatus Omnitrophota bacterium]